MGGAGPGLLPEACLVGELGGAGAPGGWGAGTFFSSEKSCLITSKKLLKGLPTQTGRRTEREQTTDEHEANERRGAGGGRPEGRSRVERREEGPAPASAAGRNEAAKMFYWRTSASCSSEAEVKHSELSTHLLRNGRGPIKRTNPDFSQCLAPVPECVLVPSR